LRSFIARGHSRCVVASAIKGLLGVVEERSVGL
jgi:hypothetical protein